MNGIKRFVVSASYLACVSILLRAVSVSFNAYVSTKVGAEGMGLFSLVMSVYSFAVTLACSGINLASTRLTAKILSSANAENIRSESRKLMRSCAAYSLFFGTAAGAALFFGSGIIGEKLLCDARTVPSLKALALSLPAISLSTALCGYFTGARRVSRNAAVMIAEQANKILLITAMLVLFAPRGLQWACFAVVAGGSVSEGFSLAFSYLFYRADMRRLKRGRNIFSANAKNGFEDTSEIKNPAERDNVSRASDKAVRHKLFSRFPVFGEICDIAIPVALGAYIRQGLVMLEHAAVPWGLRRFGKSSSDALSSYGILHSMALPVVMFPYAVIGAFTSLLVPEMTSFAERGESGRALSAARRVISTTVFFGIGAAGIFMTFWYELGLSVYSSAEAGRMIRLLAPVLPMMFLDTTVDAMLKGLGEQVYCVKVNIADAVTSLFLVLFLVPRAGIFGYIAVIYVSEAVNASLSVSKLCRVVGLGMDLTRFIALPLISLGSAFAFYGLFSEYIFMFFGFSDGSFGIIVYFIIYCLTGAILTKLLKHAKKSQTASPPL